jgi:hypothetical protein
MYQVGFSSAIFGNNALNTLPTSAAYFIATTSQTWMAVTRSAAGVETMTDTNVSTSTQGLAPTGISNVVAFQKLRVELSSTTAVFMINGTIVASHTLNIPSAALAPTVLVDIFSQPGEGHPGYQPRLLAQALRVWIDDPVGGYVSSQGESAPAYVYDRISGADIASAGLAENAWSFVAGMLASNATSSIVGSTTPMVRKSFGRYDQDVMGVISTSPYAVLGQENADTVRVATMGRVPLIVSLENGPILQGDRITASSIEGVGMRATRAGAVVGVAIDSFATSSVSTYTECDEQLAADLLAAGVEVPEYACLAKVLVSIKIGGDMNMGGLFSDATGAIATMADAMSTLAATVFEKGAELTRLVVGEIVAKVAVVGKLLAESIYTKELCIADDSGAETCITKSELDALLVGAPLEPSSGSGGDEPEAPTDTDTDEEAPNVIINGNSPATVPLNSAYIDLGATVSDNVDQSIGLYASVDGGPTTTPEAIFIDTAVVGEHTVLYSATDQAGNVGTATRIVVVE